MNPLFLLLLALGLAMDAFAVALACSVTLRSVSRRQFFRITFHFGLFQALMLTIGWGLGAGFGHLIEHWDHWLAFGLLAIIGSKAILNGFKHEAEPLCGRCGDPTRGWSLVMFSVATSLDAMAAGLSLAVVEQRILLPALCVGLVTCVVSALGMRLGGRLGLALGRRYGKRVEAAGGLMLLLIGVRILMVA